MRLSTIISSAILSTTIAILGSINPAHATCQNPNASFKLPTNVCHNRQAVAIHTVTVGTMNFRTSPMGSVIATLKPGTAIWDMGYTLHTDTAGKRTIWRYVRLSNGGKYGYILDSGVKK